MNRNFLVRLHRTGPWIIGAAIVLYVVFSPLIFRFGTGNSWVWRWLIFGGLTALLAIIYAVLSHGVLTTETRIGLAIAQAQERGQQAERDADGQKDPYALPVPGSADAVREENSVRTTLLALGRKVQASAHRIQEEAGRMVQRHQNDPDVLETSMRVDHAAAQQARLAQSIATLCGVPPGQQWHDPLPLADVVRAAAGRITAYQRVVVEGDPNVAVEGAVAEPLIHLTAELLANATQSSPPGTQVTVTLRSVHSGAAIEVDDTGVGMDEADMNRAREVVSGRHPMGIVDLGEVPQTGLAVVGAYSRRHGFRVDLTDSVHGGVRAVVLVPSDRLIGTGGPTFEDTTAGMFSDAGSQPSMPDPLLASNSGIQQAPMQQQAPVQQAPMPPQQPQQPMRQQQPMQPMPQAQQQYPQGMPQRQPMQSMPPGQQLPQGRQAPQRGQHPSQPQVPPILRGAERPEIPDYPDFSNLPASTSSYEAPERSMQRPAARPVRQMRPMRDERPNQLPQGNSAPPAQRTSSQQSAPALPATAPADSGEVAGYTPDGLPQRRSRRSEAPAADESFFTRRQVDATPEPTAEQAGSWMSSFLGAGGDSPTPDHDDWSNR